MDKAHCGQTMQRSCDLCYWALQGLDGDDNPPFMVSLKTDVVYDFFSIFPCRWMQIKYIKK